MTQELRIIKLYKRNMPLEFVAKMENVSLHRVVNIVHTWIVRNSK